MRYQRLSVTVIAAVLSLALLAGLSLPCHAQETPNPPAEQQQRPEPPQHQDAPAPEPHPDLKPLVDALLELINERKLTEALQQADALLQQATEKSDKVGQAYAHRFRAWALQQQNRVDAALPAWEQAERLWREVGEGAFLVDALLGRAFCLWRTDEAGARALVEQALALAKAEARRPLAAAKALGNLGVAWYNAGVLIVAQQCYEQALALFERLAPNSLQVARTLNNLGGVAYNRGDLAGAQGYYERALSIYERLAPNSLQVATTLHNLGNVARERGDLAGAQGCYEQALALFERLAPNSLQVADTLNNLAQLALTQNQPQTALQHSQRAVAIVETQRQNIQDTETRALFAERYFRPYPLLALAYLQLNQPAQAAEALERSRARSLAETLQQRQLAFADNAPKPLRQLLQRQQQLNAKRQQVYQQLQQAEDNAVEQRAQLQRALLELDQQQRALDDRLRKEFPDYARLILPEPLTVQQIQQSLDAGTVLLYHALAENHLLIVAVSRTQVQGVARKVDGEQLERLAQSLRTALSKPLVFRDTAERGAWQAWGQQLYAQLVAPVQGLLKNAQRVLLCPDGVLSQLPWAALIVKTENGKPVYWMERVALHLTPSVGVYRQARAVEPAPQGVAIAAVWRYTNGKPIDLAQARRSEVATLLRRSGAGTVLTDLPSVQGEVQALRGLFGEGARVAVNAQATPQWARQLAASARVVHFACHARADNTDPLGSALLLAPAGSDVGMLKAGEVLLSWRLRADLVMLSACATGVGAARRYEGVYSLGRAFLVAGSRSVGMSLWEVSDEATVALMKGFYRRYVQGVAKDEALRGAQLELLRNPKYADPYFWSAFVLMGDYRHASQAGRRAAGGV